MLRGCANVNSQKGFMDALLFEESLMTQRYAIGDLSPDDADTGAAKG